MKVDFFEADLNTEVADTQGALFTESAAFSCSFFCTIGHELLATASKAIPCPSFDC
ncbi:MAG: hypothetical protein HRU08_10290 [Oleispira sp.]|nr:hypothetical protein [Oleispira sp.]